MPEFTYTEPKLYKDPENKKWFIRYNIYYKGEPKSPPIKDYGRAFFGTSLNKITDLVKREEEFTFLKKSIVRNLEEGIDLRRPKTVKAVIDKKIKNAKPEILTVVEDFRFDKCLHSYLQHKEYINPVSKKKQSAVTITMFLKNQFRPFLEKNGLLDDVRNVTSKNLLDFCNYYYTSADPKVKWGNNTFNNKRSYLSSFFSLLKEQMVISVNPVTSVKPKPKRKTQRFGIFTREERDILFAYLEENNYFLSVMCKLIYYSFIRGSESSRTHVADYSIEKRQIRIDSDDAKTQYDNLDRYILMVKPLQVTLIEYLSKYEHKPEWYMFGNEDKPSPVENQRRWYEDFGIAMKALSKKHPNLFNRPNLTYYCLKHSGVTHLIEDLTGKYPTIKLLQFVQQMCRHESFTDTQLYWKQLGFQLDTFDDFIDL